ncbi:DUF3265 domain-containing protein [Vibrio sp. V38_P2S17PM301]|nr:DUF3265 domain-containing protein [Vibrio sp. V36_P2S2PM302]NAX27722.1 DUF3265 domain-containing protein [Vibrio sp. V38_P2S17PM301]
MVITKRLRGTWHAWHFQFALGVVSKVLCRNFGIVCLHPLTRRYVAASCESIFVIQFRNWRVLSYVNC